ncbi:MAG: ABC transporter substrate-binding protein [Deltaproteobacteria bacterium]
MSPDFQQTLGADADYVTSREVWSLDLTQTNPLAEQVNALFRARYGADLNGNSARGFIGMMTLAEAINRAAATDPDAVRAALRATDIPAEQLIAPWQGIRFDATGQNTLGDGIVVQMLNGRYTIVWPAAIAVEPVVFPFPEWDTQEGSPPNP